MILLENIDNKNMAEYTAFEKRYNSDLSQYQSRILPDKNTELIKWCYIKADNKLSLIHI